MAPLLAAFPSPPRSATRPQTEAPQPPLASCAGRRAARHAEVIRDAQVVAEGLRDALGRILEAALPPEQIWIRVGEAVAASRAAHRALGDARITLRACRSAVHADSAPLPASLAFYRHSVAGQARSRRGHRGLLQPDANAGAPWISVARLVSPAVPSAADKRLTRWTPRLTIDLTRS